jgi:hypothetical protein
VPPRIPPPIVVSASVDRERVELVVAGESGDSEMAVSRTPEHRAIGTSAAAPSGVDTCQSIVPVWGSSAAHDPPAPDCPLDSVYGMPKGLAIGT